MNETKRKLTPEEVARNERVAELDKAREIGARLFNDKSFETTKAIYLIADQFEFDLTDEDDEDVFVDMIKQAKVNVEARGFLSSEPGTATLAEISLEWLVAAEGGYEVDEDNNE